MRAVDTNILVRWITRDDPFQIAAADAIMAGPVFVSLTVLIELAWVLRGKTFRMRRHDLAAVLDRMLDVASITIPAEEGVRWAIGRFAAGADFADMIHVLASTPASSFVSFEAELARLAGPDSPIPIERPA